MESTLEISNLTAEPQEEWKRMLRFADLGQDDWAAMSATVEVLLQHSTELVVGTYDYLRSVPETAAILGWEDEVDEEHLEERRRFFSIWLARTLGLDTSDEFANYLFRAGKYHAGQGPRQIHTPTAYVTVSIGLVLASFARYMANAHLPGEVTANAMAGWTKYLSVQLNQMLQGYRIAQEMTMGELPIRFSLYGRLRPIVGQAEIMVNAPKGATVADLLRKFFNYYPQARSEALERTWQTEENGDSLWVEITPTYHPRPGWRVLLNGRDLNYEEGFVAPVKEKDEISVFPPGR
jgi:molybdopterin converting factor small subunit